MLKNELPVEQLNGQRVKVYRNLHKQCLSVMLGGHVVAHVQAITLGGVEFKVSEAGRRRVIEERRKNVHAFVVGHVISVDVLPQDTDHKVSYNPYKASTFTAADGAPVLSADCATVTTRGVFLEK